MNEQEQALWENVQALKEENKQLVESVKELNTQVAMLVFENAQVHNMIIAELKRLHAYIMHGKGDSNVE